VGFVEGVRPDNAVLVMRRCRRLCRRSVTVPGTAAGHGQGKSTLQQRDELRDGDARLAQDGSQRPLRHRIVIKHDDPTVRRHLAAQYDVTFLLPVGDVAGPTQSPDGLTPGDGGQNGSLIDLDDLLRDRWRDGFSVSFQALDAGPDRFSNVEQGFVAGCSLREAPRERGHSGDENAVFVRRGRQYPGRLPVCATATTSTTSPFRR